MVNCVTFCFKKINVHKKAHVVIAGDAGAGIDDFMLAAL
jgi:hypothetical protein